MALSITKFGDAFDYKIVHETVCNNTAKVNVTSSAGSIYSINLINGTTSAAYFKFFNTNSVTMGTTDADLVLAVPATTTSFVNIPEGLPFDNLSFACTLYAGPRDNNALTANSGALVDVKIVCS